MSLPPRFASATPADGLAVGGADGARADAPAPADAPIPAAAPPPSASPSGGIELAGTPSAARRDGRPARQGALPAAPPTYDASRERLEIELLLEGIFRQYGYDFRAYAYASIRRRLWKHMIAGGVRTVSGLQERVLHDGEAMDRLLLDLSVNVTAMYRDPRFYQVFRDVVVPRLRTYPFLRIWHAGCSTGEEVVSMAILLQEEGLYDRTRVYATDINEAVLQRARTGIFPLERMQEYTENYIRAGGRRSFSEYYTAKYDGALFSPALLENVVFSQHNLATDRSFAEFNVIVCRNVLIYFDRTLQAHVHGLFYDSLATFGVLGLGSKESLRLSPYDACYEALPGGEKLYRKVR